MRFSKKNAESPSAGEVARLAQLPGTDKTDLVRGAVQSLLAGSDVDRAGVWIDDGESEGRSPRGLAIFRGLVSERDGDGTPAEWTRLSLEGLASLEPLVGGRVRRASFGRHGRSAHARGAVGVAAGCMGARRSAGAFARRDFGWYAAETWHFAARADRNGIGRVGAGDRTGRGTPAFAPASSRLECDEPLARRTGSQRADRSDLHAIGGWLHGNCAIRRWARSCVRDPANTSRLQRALRSSSASRGRVSRAFVVCFQIRCTSPRRALLAERRRRLASRDRELGTGEYLATSVGRARHPRHHQRFRASLAARRCCTHCCDSAFGFSRTGRYASRRISAGPDGA